MGVSIYLQINAYNILQVYTVIINIIMIDYVLRSNKRKPSEHSVDQHKIKSGRINDQKKTEKHDGRWVEERWVKKYII